MITGVSVVSPSDKKICFTSRLPKGVFYDAKDIPRLRCAKCGKHMISKDEESIIMYGKPNLNSQDILNKLPPDIKTEMPYGYKYTKDLLDRIGISSVKKFFFDNKDAKIEGQSDEQSKQIHTVLEKVFEISNEKEAELLPISKVMKNIRKIKSVFPAETEEFIDILADYTEQYPGKSLTAIITDKNLLNYHELLAENQSRHYNNLTKKHFDKMLETARKLPKDMVSELESLNASAKDISRHKSNSDELRNALLKNLYSDFLDKLPDNSIKRTLEKQINVIPLAHASGDYIFCRASKIKNINDERIISFIIYPKRNTFEHVNAKSLGGPNDISNGIYMCSHCNHERGINPYPFMMSVFPEFIENTQKQISRLGTFISRGSLLGYDNYPQDIKKTLKSVSGKDINIDTFIRNEKHKNKTI